MWLIIAVISYLINAGVYVADKFLLSKKIHSSISYAFFVGIWSIFNFIILPLDFWLPNLQELGLDILAGVLFLVTLIFWYKALHQSEATRVVPIVGALVPVFSFILSFIFLGQSLSERELLAFLILIGGGLLISIKQTKFYLFRQVRERVRFVFGDILGGIHAAYRPTQRLILNSVTSALFFAAYYVLIKYIYMHQPFVGAFVWSRLGSFIASVSILLIPAWRHSIKESRSDSGGQSGNLFFFFSVRLLAAFAFIMLNWAISKGNVALINSLQGVQYVFLILLVLFISAKYPKVSEEELGGGVLIQKVIGATLVSAGLYMLIT
ncbi:EamA family transporter [Candidatus Parcubacteria bacterium]|nr:EamA family transporter [Patescibacteria group bacterium]MBU4309819.1 EamA family transporter [Patescibacteria group bacterium]MBU4432233.1 EamA family transporter [Patescibacteria group bacterium]MBU4578158.1 EamA family transporter [Patescibacteria group bacterium]MCG2696695.1 EamA family transporter [Candidatus Parcubacteria bacterium]